MKGNLGI